MSNEHTAPEFEFDGITYTILIGGAVRIGQSGWMSELQPDEFKQLVDAQQRTVWAAQHWTSLAAVSDALSSLLAVHAARVQLSGVYAQTDGKGHVTHYKATLLLLHSYRSRDCESTADVQTLFRELNDTPLSAVERYSP